ncbi:MAG TPA: hypothetical protein VG890_10445 [Puia sp.]|nr:hypothetical protein [Puia sp.]
MYSKLTTLLIPLFILTVHASCQNTNPSIEKGKQIDTTKSSTEIFFKQVMQLDEFKQEQIRIDSIKKASGLSVKFHVDIVDSSFLTEDKGKNISLAFINEDYPYDPNRTIYTIKFDKDKQKIISVDKDKKQFEQSDDALPKDIPLPQKNN